MSEFTPAPPPPGAARARPGVVTAAAVLLIVAGALSVITGLLLLGGAGTVAGTGVSGLFLIVGIISLAVGALEIYAGVQVLGLREIGRKIGVVIAAIGALFSLLSIGRAPASAVIGIAIDAFIIWALTTNAELFRN